MIIAPILAPSLSGLTATPALRGNLLTWATSNDALLFGTEVWASKTNDRATATQKATVVDNTYIHLVAAGETWYYWIRAVSIYQRSDGAWYPTSSTGGVSSTSLQAQTTDIASNAITSVSVAQSNSALSQTNYSVWENVFSILYPGSGYTFIMDVRHLANLTLTTIGTSQSAKAQQRLTLNEYTVYVAGTVSVTTGSAVVTGSGTLWATNLSAGQIFFLPGGSRYAILSVDSNTQITLSANYAGATASGQGYYVITSTVGVFTLTQETSKFEIIGAYCISSGEHFNHRIAVGSTAGKLYDIILDWTLVRDNGTWSISNSSILKTLVLEEVKR